MTAVGTTRTPPLFTTSFISSVILQQWLTRCGELTEPKSAANENKTLRAAGIDDLVGSRYTWLRNPVKWTQKDKDTFYALQSKGLKIARAWAIKVTLLELWSYCDDEPARAFFKKGYWWATHSRLKPDISVAKMLKNHLDNIMTYLKHRITNATAEGFNSKIQSIKSAARGFRNFENYRVSILFHYSVSLWKT